MENVLKVAIAAVSGRVPENFTKGQTSDSLREAFIEMNGGEKKINLKTYYRGSKLFDLIENLIPVIVDEGIRADNELMALCDYINIADGDVNEFRTAGEANFIVADVAAGIQGVRRQRIPDGYTVSVTTNPKSVRVYDGLNRFLAGKVNYDEFVTGVAVSFERKIREDAYNCIAGITSSTSGLNSTYVVSGSYSEGVILTLMEHVEASTGKSVQIIGTKTALRKLVPGTVADSAKEDLYKMGIYNYFNGAPMIRMKQAHKPGTDSFVLSDSKIYLIATDAKPIKIVNEGAGYMMTREASSNADLTQEYVYIQPYGVGAFFSEKMGVYTISG